MRTGLLVTFLVLSAGAVAILVGIALTSRGPAAAQQVVQPRGYALQRIWFGVLGVAVVLAFVISLPFFPYADPASLRGARHFDVTAMQYSFAVPPVVPAGVPVVFDVTSRDVNHGFGIYDPSDVLIAQVQAMPHYVNHLRLTLTRRGRYTIRCLEYCGIVHPFMRAEFDVE